MADHLSRIIGTEEDKINCSFYYKIGACRHGDRCSRTHLRPLFSQTLLIPHMYLPPPPQPDGQPVDDTQAFEDFYEEVTEEFLKFGEVEEIHVIENLGDHMFGNLYVKYRHEDDAEKCLKALSGRYYAGRLIMPEYSPVTDFREARCRQFEESECARGGYCNFMHLKPVPRHLRRMLRKARKKKRHSRSRSRRRKRSRSGSRRRSRSRGKDDDNLRRASSQERRAKIAEWNKSKDGDSKSSSKSSGNGQPPAVTGPLFPQFALGYGAPPPGSGSIQTYTGMAPPK
jgi:splicing factor U2AF subunit